MGPSGANARDAEGIADLFAPDAVLAYPLGSTTVGREAIQAVLEAFLEHASLPIPSEEPLPTVKYGDLALTSTSDQ